MRHRFLRYGFRLVTLSASMLMLLFLPPAEAQLRPMQVSDLTLMRGVADPQISPDGRSVAYVLTTTDYKQDRATSEIVLVSLRGGDARTLVAGSSPRWSPDGRQLAYMGREEGDRGIFLYDLASGGSRFLAPVHATDHFLGRVDKNFEWSPDGKWIAYVGGESAPDPDALKGILVFDRILYKTRTSFSDNRRSHIWVVATEGGEPRLLTGGNYDEHSLSWSPDSRFIAFASNRSADPDNDHSDDLWTVEVATARITRLTNTSATEYQPVWSPDGRWIAFRGNIRPKSTKDSNAEDGQLFLIPATGGEPRSLTRDMDRRVSAIRWAPASDALYFTAGDRGATSIYRVPARGGEIRQITRGEMQSGQYSLDRRGANIAFVRSEMTRPSEVWVAGANGTNPRRLTNVHDPFVRQIVLQDAETLWYESFDGKRVQGWLMKPVGFQEGRKYPLILYIHGGPHGMYGYGFSDAFQLLAARGYAVLFLNPRGSTGYGQAFSDGSVLNWGGGDYKDLMAGVDHALAQYSWLDAERMGVVGGSYGGYMTNWIITQTNRFKGAVSRASVSNLISFYGTSIYPDLIEVEFNGLPWNNYSLLWHWSPLAHVRNATTPILFLHGENDMDVPFSQAEEMFIGLKKLGVETVLVRYPGEGHGISGPKHRLDFFQRINDWFDRYVMGGPVSALQQH